MKQFFLARTSPLLLVNKCTVSFFFSASHPTDLVLDWQAQVLERREADGQDLQGIAKIMAILGMIIMIIMSSGATFCYPDLIK